MALLHVPVPKERLAAFCRQNHIRRLSFFGSALREDFRLDSDVDILVEFEPGHRVSFFSMSRMERELSEILGRNVDLRTPAELSPYFREEVIRSSVVAYAEG
jgi:predicted nucleotidyltransferase